MHICRHPRSPRPIRCVSYVRKRDLLPWNCVLLAHGYLDEEGMSQELTNNFLHTCSALAEKYQDKVCILLSTAAVCSLNTSLCDTAAPESRGSRIERSHGQSPSYCCRSFLRSLKGWQWNCEYSCLWSSSRGSLAVIHDVSGQVKLLNHLKSDQSRL